MSLEKILGGLEKTVKELNKFTEKNSEVVEDLSVKLAVATEDQSRAERVAAKLNDLLS